MERQGADLRCFFYLREEEAKCQYLEGEGKGRMINRGSRFDVDRDDLVWKNTKTKKGAESIL